MNKTVIVMNIYEDLLDGKIVNVNSCCVDYGISIPTFYRYMNVIRNHAMERHGIEVIYNQEKAGYFMELPYRSIEKR